MTNTFIHLRSSLENHSWFQTKMDKVYTHFQTETTQKPYLYDLHKGVPLRVWNNSITAFEQWFNFICWIFFGQLLSMIFSMVLICKIKDQSSFAWQLNCPNMSLQPPHLLMAIFAFDVKHNLAKSSYKQFFVDRHLITPIRSGTFIVV